MVTLMDLIHGMQMLCIEKNKSVVLWGGQRTFGVITGKMLKTLKTAFKHSISNTICICLVRQIAEIAFRVSF